MSTKYEVKPEIVALAVKMYNQFHLLLGTTDRDGNLVQDGAEMLEDPKRDKEASAWLAAANTARPEIFNLCETLDRAQYRKMLGALCARYVTKYGIDDLPDKARAWLNRHGWVKVGVGLVLGALGAWCLNSCTYSQSATGKDGTTSTRIFALDAGTARDLIKLYGIPEVPSVKVQSTK